METHFHIYNLGQILLFRQYLSIVLHKLWVIVYDSKIMRFWVSGWQLYDEQFPFRMIGGGMLSICCAKEDESLQYFLKFATLITRVKAKTTKITFSVKTYPNFRIWGPYSDSGDKTAPESHFGWKNIFLVQNGFHPTYNISQWSPKVDLR